jgi:hypothetical protein
MGNSAFYGLIKPGKDTSLGVPMFKKIPLEIVTFINV